MVILSKRHLHLRFFSLRGSGAGLLLPLLELLAEQAYLQSRLGKAVSPVGACLNRASLEEMNLEAIN